MSEVNRDKAFDRAVDLVINQDRCVENWTKHLIAVQASLVVAEGVLLAWGRDTPGWAITFPALLIGAAAITLLCAMTRIIVRQCKWQGCYVGMVKRTEGGPPFFLYQDQGDSPSKPKLPYVARVVKGSRTLLTIIWIVFLFLWVCVQLRAVDFGKRIFFLFFKEGCAG